MTLPNRIDFQKTIILSIRFLCMLFFVDKFFYLLETKELEQVLFCHRKMKFWKLIDSKTVLKQRFLVERKCVEK